MHRIEARYEIIFDNRNRPLEGTFARDAWGKWLVYLATEFLRKRNWKELDNIGKVYLKPLNDWWYVGRTRRGELYETATLPVVDEEQSTGYWLAILIAARRTGLPFRAYAKEGPWDHWREFDTRYQRQATAGLQEGRGHQQGACDSPREATRAVVPVESLGSLGRPSDSGFSGDHNPERCPGQREHQAELVSDTASVEGWGTRGSAIHESGMPLSRTPQED